MDANNVPVIVAFLGGLVSFISPCVFSLVPAYVGYLSSRAVTADGQVVENRWATLLHGTAFVLGFGVVFVSLGAAVGAAGNLLYDFKDIAVRLGGVIVILFGLHTMGVIHLSLLDYDTRPRQAPVRRWGYLSSALMGVFFSAGWSPCVGPVLGAVYGLVLNEGNVSRSVVLLTAYSLGLGIPFLLAAAGIGNASEALRRYGKYLRYVSLVTGALLIFVGVLLFTNSLAFFARFAPFTQFQIALDDGVVSFWRWLTGGGG